MFDCSPIGICVCDADLRIVVVNSAWAAMDGVLPEEHRGKTVREVLNVGTCPVEAAMSRVLETGVAIFGLEVTAKIPVRSGIGRWLVNLIPLRNEHGETTHIGSITVETTPKTGFQSFLVAHGYAVEQSRGDIGYLSPREIEVTRLLAQGKSNKEISQMLKISVRTVETHRRRAMKNLGFHSLAQLATYAMRNGLVE
jgi:DNA-binding CsgD family transcriptional regulator